MPFFDGSGSNGLAVVVDTRSQFDADNGQVLRDWATGRRALGRAEWQRTLRIALREAGTEPWNAKRLKEERDAIVRTIRDLGVRCVVPVQTMASPGIRQVHSAWNLFGAAGNPYKWAGTCLVSQLGVSVCPILNPGNYEFVYGWLIGRWIRQALAVAQGTLSPMPWPEAITFPCERMLQRIFDMYVVGAPIALDIETSMDGSIITAIGFADRHGSVSVPWHGYTIAGRLGEREPGLTDYPLGEAIRDAVVQLIGSAATPKILHNGAFDVVQLAKHGMTLRAFAHDTLLMHRVVYPQFRHGLQQACATEFCVEPWKSLHRLPKVEKGEDEWLGDPEALRLYNCKDTYATWQLWKHLERKLG